jgi:hypothetical protein
LLAGEEGVTLVAHVGVDDFFGGAGRPSVAARANHFGFRVELRMNTLFHVNLTAPNKWEKFLRCDETRGAKSPHSWELTGGWWAMQQHPHPEGRRDAAQQRAMTQHRPY